MKKRLPYIIAFTVLLAVECIIGAFVHDSFVRPYVGDMLVTVLLCALMRIFLPERPRLLPLWVFLFSAAVELSQLTGIASAIARDNEMLNIALGSVFDPADLICYAAGCLLFFAAEALGRKKHDSL